MKVLVGECTGRMVPELQRLGWGRMWIARGRNIYTYPGEPWGLDNGAFRDWQQGSAFDGDAFQRVIEKAMKQPDAPYLAVLPDRPGTRHESLALSASWLDRVPGGWPWYLALQDGMVPEDVKPFLGRITGLFLGGTNRFKGEAPKWRAVAKRDGLAFHYGRCGTSSKIAQALALRVDSLDSALAMWTRDRWELFVREVTTGAVQQDLFLEAKGEHGG
jgi:hypothetical protein